jgi:hypothetical protein
MPPLRRADIVLGEGERAVSLGGACVDLATVDHRLLVTGTVFTKNANGAGNIAELNLDATQIGNSTGLLAHAVEVLRLNTLGGVAAAGTCDPQATPIVLGQSATRPAGPGRRP